MSVGSKPCLPLRAVSCAADAAPNPLARGTGAISLACRQGYDGDEGRPQARGRP